MFVKIPGLSEAHQRGEHIRPEFGCDECKLRMVRPPTKTKADDFQERFASLITELQDFRNRLDSGRIQETVDTLLDRATDVENSLDNFLKDYDALRRDLGRIA